MIEETIPLLVPPQNITLGYSTSFNNPDIEGVGSSNPYLSNTSHWFTLLNETEPQDSIFDFKNTTLLATVFQKVFRSLLAQTAKAVFSSPEAN